MLTIICITILAYWIMGRDIDTLLEKVKDYDLRGKMGELYAKIQPYALKAGRAAARPLLQFYCVMSDKRSSVLDRALIYAAIIYTVSPVSLLPSAVYKLLGVLDEGAAVIALAVVGTDYVRRWKDRRWGNVLRVTSVKEG